jgi:hypothetical protein
MKTKTIPTHFGSVSLDEKGYPDQKGVDTLFEELDYQRACQLFLWGFPAVSIQAQWRMQKHFGATGPYDMFEEYESNAVASILTPNTSVAYYMSISNLLETIINHSDHSGISSRSEGVKTNDDGSVDLFLGPDVPAGQEGNWIKTNPGEYWFAYFRLYAPTEAYFDKSWPLPDIEKVN